MSKTRVQCQDKYEAQKLASIIYLQEKGETFLHAVIGVYGQEVVLALKDKSAHSVIMADSSNAETFVDFAQSVIACTDTWNQYCGLADRACKIRLVVLRLPSLALLVRAENTLQSYTAFRPCSNQLPLENNAQRALISSS